MKPITVLRTFFWLNLMLACWLSPLCAQQAATAEFNTERLPSGAGPYCTVRVAPRSVRANGKWHLAYELHLRNQSPNAVDLRSVEVWGEMRDERRPTRLVQYEGKELADNLFYPTPSDMPLPRLRLPAGQQAVVFLWVTVATETEVPASLHHRVRFAEGNHFRSFVVDSARTQICRTPLPVLHQPLAGEGWYALNGPDNDSVHRRAMFSIGGQLLLAQRFAIDWIRFDQNGATYTGDPRYNTSYHAYGAEALAVADGIVTAVQDGIPENIPGPTRAVPMTLETLPGNYVIVKLNNGAYAVYAHLQPHSLRVRKGDRVLQGQALGLVGNSGNSSEPHLHFHLGDANSPLAAEGIPYTLDAFEVTEDGQSWELRREELPLDGAIVRFLNATLSWVSALP
ncbi:MAG: M23 family metallopeptidase [Blastocatellia bacterium]